MKKTSGVIVYTPQGAGKTRRSAEIARHFGKTKIVDPWSPGDLLPADAVAFTNAPNVPGAITFTAELKALITSERTR